MSKRLVIIAVPMLVIVAVATLYVLWQRPQLNVLNWDYYIGETTIDTFQAKYGVRVNYKVYDSNEQARNFIAQAPGVYDIVIPSDYMMSFMIRQGTFLQEVDLSQLSNYQNVSAKAKKLFEDNGWSRHCVPYLYGTTGFAVDTSKVSMEARNVTWEMLARDAREGKVFKNKLVVLDDARQVLGSVLLELGKDPNSTNAEDLDSAVRLLQDVKNSVLEFSADTGKERMVTGEAAIAFAWSGDALQVRSELPQWQYSVPVSGGLKFQDGVCIPANAPNPERALNFIDHLLERDVHKEILETTKYLTTNTVGLGALRGPVREALREAASTSAPLHFVSDLDDSGTSAFEGAWERVKG